MPCAHIGGGHIVSSAGVQQQKTQVYTKEAIPPNRHPVFPGGSVIWHMDTEIPQEKDQYPSKRL